MGFESVNATLEECAAVCLGFTCDMYTKESCMLVQTEYGCDCPGCHCDADLVYRNDIGRQLRSNYTYYDDDDEAEEELIMVLCLIIFGTILAIGLTYIAMLTYRNYKYPPLPPQPLEPQVIEFEIVEKGEEIGEEAKQLEY